MLKASIYSILHSDRKISRIAQRLYLYTLCAYTIFFAICFYSVAAWAAATPSSGTSSLFYSNDILPAIILAVVAALLLIRGIYDHKMWRILAGFYVLLLSIVTAFTMPASLNGVPLILWMPKLVAASLALFIFPLLGRMIMQTHTHRIADASLLIAAVLGFTPILAAFPHFNQFLYFFHLWHAYFLISVLACIPSILCRRPASLLFLIISALPLLGLVSIIFPDIRIPFISWYEGVLIITDPSVALILQALYLFIMPSPRLAEDTIHKQVWKKHNTHKNKQAPVKPHIVSIHDFEHLFSSDVAETTLPPESELIEFSDSAKESAPIQNADEVQDTPTADITDDETVESPSADSAIEEAPKEIPNDTLEEPVSTTAQQEQTVLQEPPILNEEPSISTDRLESTPQQYINTIYSQPSQMTFDLSHIMIVSANSDNRQTWAYYLENPSYEISLMRTVENALQAYSQHPAIIVILDGEMPDTDIISAVKQFRSIEQAYSYMPAFMLVLANNNDQGNRLMQSGCTHALVKPVPSKMLRRGIQALIQEAQRRIAKLQPNISQEIHTPEQQPAEQPSPQYVVPEVNQSVIEPAPKYEIQEAPADKPSEPRTEPKAQKPVAQPTIKASAPETKQITINPKEANELLDIRDSIRRARSQNTGNPSPSTAQASSGITTNLPSKDAILNTSELNELYDFCKNVRARTPKTNFPQEKQNEVNQESPSQEAPAQVAVEEQKPSEATQQAEVPTEPCEPAPQTAPSTPVPQAPQVAQERLAHTSAQKSFTRTFPTPRPNVVTNPEHKRTAIKVSSAPKVLPDDTYFAPQPKPGFISHISRLFGKQTAKQNDFTLSGLSNASTEHLVGEPMPIISHKTQDETPKAPIEALSNIEQEPLSMTPTQTNAEQDKE